MEPPLESPRDNRFTANQQAGPPPQADEPRTPRPHTVLAALISAVLVALMILLPRAEDQQTPTEHGRHRLEQMELVSARFLGRLAIVIKNQVKDAEVLQELLEDAPVRSVRGRCSIISLAYLVGLRDTAREYLDQLKELMAQDPAYVSEEDRVLVELLEEILAGERRSLSPEEQRFLTEELGWFGEGLVARVTGRPAWEQEAMKAGLRAAAALVILVCSFIVLFVVGTVSWVLLLYRGALDSSYLQLKPARLHSGFFLEAFATMLALFVAGQLFLPAIVQDPITGTLMVQAFALIGLLVLRRTGTPSETWLGDIGLRPTADILREVLRGIRVYALVFPLLLTGGAYTVLLSQLIAQEAVSGSPLAPSPQPMHPAIDVILEGRIEALMLVVLAAVVGAPIVEEIMFRGLLYRVFRSYTGWLARGWSVLCSSLVTGLIFAMVHPQGTVAVPVLTCIAVSLAVGRERYGSLIPSMVAHALNNGIIFLFVILVLM